MEYRVVPPRTNNLNHIDNSKSHLSLYRKDDWGCSYLPVPKNATTSMIKWMGGRMFTPVQTWKESCQKCCEIRIHTKNLCEICGTKSSTKETMVGFSWPEMDKIIENDIKLFVVRNPLKRIISIFFHMLQEVNKGYASFYQPSFYFPTPHQDIDMDKLTLLKNHPALYNKNSINMRGITDDLEVSLSLVESFDLFLKSLQNNNFYDSHAFPQKVFLTDRHLTIDDVELLLFENLEAALNNFCKKYNFTPIPQLEVINITQLVPGAKKEIEEYVNSNKNIQNKIKEIYKEDWEMYNKIKNGV